MGSGAKGFVKHTVAPALVAVSVAVAAAEARAQQAVLSTDLPGEGLTTRTHNITVRVEGEFDKKQRLAAFIDQTDVSALMRDTPSGWSYDATLLPLPAGEHEFVVWIAGDSAWHEALRQTFRVPGALGIESAKIDPALDVGVKSRLASAFEPEPTGERSRFNDLDGQFGIASEVVRHGGLRFGTRAQLVGNSERNRTLRFGELGDDAPRVDLASYVVQLRQSGFEIAAGNLSAGNARHLIQGFTGRGASLSLDPGSRVQVSASALHGSNIVGWDNLIGLSEPDHRLFTGSLGIEALPQSGALRLEVSALDGSVLGRGGFDRGGITDAETSTGYALRLQSQALDRRLRLEAGFTRSSFDNPIDPTLASDTTVVDVARETRDAQFLGASLDVLRDLRLGATRSARLTIGWSHERVDPLFRSVAASPRADFLQNRWEARGDIAGITLSADHGRSRDNLAAIASLLTSHTRQTGLDVGVPLAALLSRSWLPHLRWRTGRTHQFGEGIPENGGFDASHVPDQVSTEHSLGADVRVGMASVGYRFDISEQDNRQTGRENADLERTANSITALLAPLRTLSVSLDFALSEGRSVERDEIDRNRRIGVAVNWSPLPDAALGLQLADTHNENDGRGDAGNDRSWSAQWASPVPGFRTMGARWVLRFAHAENSARTLSAEVRRKQWVLDAGFNLSIQ